MIPHSSTPTSLFLDYSVAGVKFCVLVYVSCLQYVWHILCPMYLNHGIALGPHDGCYSCYVIRHALTAFDYYSDQISEC